MKQYVFRKSTWKLCGERKNIYIRIIFQNVNNKWHCAMIRLILVKPCLLSAPDISSFDLFPLDTLKNTEYETAVERLLQSLDF